MIGTYGAVLSHPGAKAFTLAGLVGRLPISMAGLGIVLLVQASSGSYALAGSVSGAFMVANAGLAIVQGRLLDRVGQGRVVAVTAVLFAVSASLLVVAVQAGWALGWVYVLAALAGGSQPQVGSAVRARWSHVLDRPGDVQTAFALEAVLDEVVFMTGPVLVTLLATSVHPTAGLSAAVVAGAVGGLAFAAQRRTEPPAHPRESGLPDTHGGPGPRPRLPWATVLPLAVVCAALGVLFGAAEVVTVAFSDEQGRESAAGFLLALYALGSLLAGLVVGTITWRSGPDVRVRWGAAAMAVAMVPLAFAPNLVVLGVLLLLGGASISPTMVAAMSLTEASVPRERLTEGMAVMQTGLVAGVAPGAALAGLVVDHVGASQGYLVSVAAGLVAAVAAQAIPRRRGATEPSAPLASS
ncbi:MFS transporter [Nocardioides bruguierae]|uniref:MFS transporter n=1 Tax=Nocardioides bruguierae TaxID=2945102 RepID=UPI0020209394|nr:MFS transporter [Nocardioides bruguierae]MCL8024343.1 MFS transporter [Nocardioides bruguierae]